MCRPSRCAAFRKHTKDQRPTGGAAVGITQPEALEGLEVHPQTVAKMIVREDLTSRGQSGVFGSLDRDEVLAVKGCWPRAEEQQQREWKARAWRLRVTVRPPDEEHVGALRPRGGRIPGVSTAALSKRARLGDCPTSSTRAGGGSGETTSSWSGTPI